MLQNIYYFLFPEHEKGEGRMLLSCFLSMFLFLNVRNNIHIQYILKVPYRFATSGFCVLMAQAYLK